MTPDSVRSDRRLNLPIVVAGDDSEHVHGVLQVAQLLSRRDGITVHVLGNVPPLALPAGIVSDDDRGAIDDGRRRRHLDRVRRRVTRAVGISAQFSVDVAIGRRSRILARAARADTASLILTGIGDADTAEREATDDATFQLILEAEIPVVAVPTGSVLLPRRGLVALDFGSSSQHAARAALLMLDGPSTLILAHVQPPIDDGDDFDWHDAYTRWTEHMLETTAKQFEGAGDVTVETLQLEGDPQSALLNAARTAVVDFVACGIEGFAAESPLPAVAETRHAGSVAFALIHRSPGMVLVAPG